MIAAFSPHRIRNLRALNDSVIVADMSFAGRTLSSGIILHNDNGTTAGIRPRWGQVYAVGPEQQDVRPGQWLCYQGTRTIRKIDPQDILLVSDQEPGTDDTISDAIQAQAKNRF